MPGSTPTATESTSFTGGGRGDGANGGDRWCTRELMRHPATSSNPDAVTEFEALLNSLGAYPELAEIEHVLKDVSDFALPTASGSARGAKSVKPVPRPKAT